MSHACFDAAICLMPVDSSLLYEVADTPPSLPSPSRALPALWFEFSQCQPLAPSRRKACTPGCTLNPETRPSSRASGTPCATAKTMPVVGTVAVPISFLAFLHKR
jgi:hypothetical protein